MKAYWKGLLFMVVVVSFIAGGPLLSGSNGSARAAMAGFEVSGYINPGDSLSSLYFVGKHTDSNGQSAYFTQILNDAYPANELTPFSFTAYTFSPLTSYTLLAIHDQLNDGVTVGSNTILAGSTWDSLFGTQYTQSTFASLLNGSYINLYLEEFYANNPTLLGTSMGNTLTLVNFSDATYAGTAYASNVPLPASLLLFGPGLASLAVLRRRFKK